MIQTLRALSTVAAVAAFTLLTACDDAPPAAATPASSARPVVKKGDVLPPEMVAAVSASKSSLILGVHFALRAQPAVGKPLPVDIAVVPHKEFEQLSVLFDSQDGLEITSGKTMGPVKAVSAEKSIAHQISLSPTKEGVFMVTAAVETQSEEGNIVRLYSIPVIVHAPGSTPASAPTAPAPAPAG